MDWDLTRLNPTGFERLVRALCFRSFGPGGTVFSPGPDGGRDFVFEGKLGGYESKGWQGYLVVQAKFRENAGRPDDVEWLIRQLSAEFRKYKSSHPAIRKPEYYILATNISLSGSDGVAPKTKKLRTGGYTKIEDALKAWKGEFGVKGVDVWSGDKIVDFLADAPGIRQSYAAWITPGDVLNKILQSANTLRPEFKHVAGRSLKNMLHRDQFVRLKDAGSVGDAQIRTSQIFIDLPLPSSRPGLGSEMQPYEHLSNCAVARLVDRAREKLDPETLADEEDTIGTSGPSRSRIVLVGGPGQGKSTATLFLTQIFRATLLEADPATRRDHNVKRLVPEILKRAEAEGIPRSIPHRYPVHISLPRFADRISQQRQLERDIPSLLSYIASEFALSSDQDITKDDLRAWIELHPWLLVLDGLDEVPPTGERPAILDAISQFFTEIAAANADILTIVTTRPQGYNKDLDPDLWEHWRLAELNRDEALKYAKALGEARYPDDKHRREDVEAMLNEASRQPATARLMISPLQVTILHFIIDTGGGVPTARWTLFNEYFEVLKRRERAKGGQTQRILERHLSHLGPIHHRAGLVLQTDSEQQGGAGGKLSHARFRDLVHKYLVSEGFSTAEVETRVKELMELALNRLVLLSTQEEEQIQFDVRSLQEFMAAAALTSGDEALMEERLAYIAGKAHWRHVFLIAASRCFADDSFHYRRATIVNIPRQMDSAEPDLLVKNGAKLALELISDGIGLDHPHSRRPLLQHSMDLLSLGPDSYDDRLVTVWDSTTLDLAEALLRERIKDGSSTGASAAWKLLFRMTREHSEWATTLIVSMWPKDTQASLLALSQATAPLDNAQLIQLATLTVASAGPNCKTTLRDFSQSLRHFQDESERNSHSDLCSLLPTGLGFDHSRRLIKVLGIESPFATLQVLLNAADSFRVYNRTYLDRNLWCAFQAAASFIDRPSKKSLHDAATIIALHSFETARSFLWLLPWPLATLICESQDPAALLKIANEVRDGERAGLKEWKSAERRWLEIGVTQADLAYLESGRFFGRDVATVGAPPILSVSISNNAEALNTSDRLADAASKVTHPLINKHLINAAHTALLGAPPHSCKSPELARRLLHLLVQCSYIRAADLSMFDLQVFQDPSLLAELVELIKRCDSDQTLDVDLGALVALFNISNTRELIQLILLSIRSSSQEDIRSAISKLDSGAFLYQPTDERRVRESVALLRMISGTSSDVCRDCEDLLSNEDRDTVSEVAIRILNGDLIGSDARISVLVFIMRQLREKSSNVSSRLAEPLRKALDTRRSELHTRSVWIDHLRLPSDSFSCLLPSQEGSPKH
ncbi:hypothetical protein [Pleomorphomonas sp. PLEO]|uniref:hypothetical protein n=1 Tax=Pleomorphomonas sp. PLEO TaxID=3239306 RepID=UPI00351DCA10